MTNENLARKMYRSMRVPLQLTPVVAMLFVSEGCKPSQAPIPQARAVQLEAEVTTNNFQSVETLANNSTNIARANNYAPANQSQTNSTHRSGGYFFGGRSSPYTLVPSTPSTGYRAPAAAESLSKSYTTPAHSTPAVSKSAHAPSPAHSSSATVTRGGFGGTGHSVGGASS